MTGPVVHQAHPLVDVPAVPRSGRGEQARDLSHPGWSATVTLRSTAVDSRVHNLVPAATSVYTRPAQPGVRRSASASSGRPTKEDRRLSDTDALAEWRARNDTAAFTQRRGLTGENLDILYSAPSTSIPTSGCRASSRSPAGSTRRCTATGCGRCACTPGSATRRAPTSAGASSSPTATTASARPSTCPTQCGLDSDAPGVAPEVGRVGVAVDCVQATSSGCSPACRPRRWASRSTRTARRRWCSRCSSWRWSGGASTPGEINGSMTTDVLKDYVARGTWIYPPAAGIRLVGDVLEYCNKEMPRFYPLVIRGPDMRDAGASAVQEVGFAFANAVAYLEHATARGLDIDKIAPRLSAQFYYYGDFLQEAAKTRAARRIWARMLTERFGARRRSSTLLRVTASVGGTHFQANEPQANIIRGHARLPRRGPRRAPGDAARRLRRGLRHPDGGDRAARAAHAADRRLRVGRDGDVRPARRLVLRRAHDRRARDRHPRHHGRHRPSTAVPWRRSRAATCSARSPARPTSRRRTSRTAPSRSWRPTCSSVTRSHAGAGGARPRQRGRRPADRDPAGVRAARDEDAGAARAGRARPTPRRARRT